MPADDEAKPHAPGKVASSAAETSIAELVTAYSTLLFRIAYSILRSSAEAEDVVQDVFLRVLQKQSTLAGIREPRIWLIRIAWNLALDRRRRIRPDQMDADFAHSLAAANLPADEVLGEASRIATLLREIDRLPAPEREVLLLAANEDLSITEIASIIQRTGSATRALLFRARTRLRERLAKGERR